MEFVFINTDNAVSMNESLKLLRKGKTTLQWEVCIGQILSEVQ